MNNKRNVILIVVIVILAFIAFQRSFLFHPFGGPHFFWHVNHTYQEDDTDLGASIDSAMNHLDDGFKELDKGLAIIDEGVGIIGEGLKENSFSKPNFDQSAAIYYGGYLKNEFTYPIIFHYDTPSVFLNFGGSGISGGKVVHNEVFYPESLKGKLGIKDLDSTNAVNVYLESKTIQTTEIVTFTRKTLKYTQRVNYHFSYPFTKKNHELTVVKDTGSFFSKCKISLSIPSKRNSNYEIEKHKRLNVVNKMVTQIRSTINKDSII